NHAAEAERSRFLFLPSRPGLLRGGRLVTLICSVLLPQDYVSRFLSTAPYGHVWPYFACTPCDVGASCPERIFKLPYSNAACSRFLPCLACEQPSELPNQIEGDEM